MRRSKGYQSKEAAATRSRCRTNKPAASNASVAAGSRHVREVSVQSEVCRFRQSPSFTTLCHPECRASSTLWINAASMVVRAPCTICILPCASLLRGPSACAAFAGDVVDPGSVCLPASTGAPSPLEIPSRVSEAMYAGSAVHTARAERTPAALLSPVPVPCYARVA